MHYAIMQYLLRRFLSKHVNLTIISFNWIIHEQFKKNEISYFPPHYIFQSKHISIYKSYRTLYMYITIITWLSIIFLILSCIIFLLWFITFLWIVINWFITFSLNYELLRFLWIMITSLRFSWFAIYLV